MPESGRWSWREGTVDRSREHFELRYGRVEDAGWSEWEPAALIGPPRGRVFPVQFLIAPLNQANRAALARVTAELTFYLTEVGEPDPWVYACYHCTTAANIYSPVHWSFIEPETPQ